MDFLSLLSDENKKQLVERRIQELAQEGYQQQMNIQIAEKIGDTSSVENIQKVIDTIGNAITVYQEEQAKLDTPNV